jgi:hypothetical protein
MCVVPVVQYSTQVAGACLERRYMHTILDGHFAAATTLENSRAPNDMHDISIYVSR